MGLGLSPDKTMALAQTLYEQGWITYMRTDGVSVAPEAQSAARDYIAREHGADYLPPEPPTYTVKTANAQEAHEAVRPTDITREPEQVIPHVFHRRGRPIRSIRISWTKAYPQRYGQTMTPAPKMAWIFAFARSTVNNGSSSMPAPTVPYTS